MIKKFIIIIILTVSMISAVSASDADEAVTKDYAESQIQEFIEVNHPDLCEIEMENIVENEIIREEYVAPNKHNQQYNDSYIINEHKNYYEIESYQYNGTYIESLINETLNNDTVLDLNISLISHYFFDNIFGDNETFILIKFNFKILDSGSSLSIFKEIIKFKILIHDNLIFYNSYYYILIHDVGKNIVFLSDKLHTKFAFSIDNSIVGIADAFMYYFLNSNFSNFHSFSLSCFHTFSNFVRIFIKID